MEWHRPEMLPVSEDILQGSITSLIGLQDWLQDGKTIYIPDTAQNPDEIEVDLSSLQMRDVQSLVLAPITIDGRVQAVLGCSNLQAPAEVVQTNLRTLELVADMLKSLFQREQLIETLEKQVAERTRQLTTFLDMAMLSDQAQDLGDILQPTLLSITQIASCDATGIHVINENESSLALIAQRGIPLEFLPSLQAIEMDTEFAAWLVDAHPREALSDLEMSTDFPEPFCLPGYGAFFANRLSTGRKSLGLLSCYRVEDHPFSPFQAALLTALGEILGTIVENYHLRLEAEELAAIEERQRLAREIHDAVSQSVYSLSLFARSANDALDDEDLNKLSSTLQDIEGTALHAMREMRLLLYQLREAGQDDDISTALDNRYKQVEHRMGIHATSNLEPDIALPMHIRHEIWRVIVEALNNTVKHAQATNVDVQIACLDEHLAVSIQDNGIGFDSSERFPGMGLKNMRTRAERLGGHLDITGQPGQGTRISLQIPMACIDPKRGA
jgi:signal transduction histidine kinase